MHRSFNLPRYWRIAASLSSLFPLSFQIFHSPIPPTELSAEEEAGLPEEVQLKGH
jgi:hypothetical protein